MMPKGTDEAREIVNLMIDLVLYWTVSKCMAVSEPNPRFNPRYMDPPTL